jgi:hypothetical membrane protein
MSHPGADLLSIADRTRRLIDEKYFPLWGIVGSAIGLIFILGSQIPYTGGEGEPFSMFNHFVSELGEYGVSEWALVFNIGMILAGITFVPFMIGLGLHLDNVISKIAGAVGVFSALSISLVGIYPMNYIEEHTLWAMSFFLSGMVMVALWTLAILIQKEARIPRLFSIGGIINFVIFFLFLYGPWESVTDIANRPEIWMVPTLEWGIYFAIIGYLLVMAVYVWRGQQGASTES